MSNEKPGKIETVVVCYTQTTFDELEKRPENIEELEPSEFEDEAVRQSRLISTLAEKLVAALTAAGVTAEIIRLPQRSFNPRDISKAAFAWRIMDLTESNGRSIDMALCLDFPSWSLQHPRKCVWLTSLPNFVIRGKLAMPIQPAGQPGSPLSAKVSNSQEKLQAENARAVSGLLQSERRGLAEAYRLLAGNRPLAEEMARRGLQVEFNPFPADLNSDPSGPEWQATMKRLLK
ncbi:MAG TPA: hypothetical protein VH186_17705 [Chloroflexia bacterium]|nr:hypothetical protein [Chloroflexia bacterium]